MRIRQLEPLKKPYSKDSVQSANNDVTDNESPDAESFLQFHCIHVCGVCSAQSVCTAHTHASHASCSAVEAHVMVLCLQLQLAASAGQGCNSK